MFNFGPIFDGVENYPKATYTTLALFCIFAGGLVGRTLGLW